MDPQAEYSARRSRFELAEQRLAKQSVTLGNWRLAVAAVAAVLAWFVFGRRSLSPWWLCLPLAAFIALAVRHSRVTRRRTLAQRGVTYYNKALARLRDAWIGAGSSTADRFRNAAHVYAEDLDLFGRGSLFELLSNARTAAGEETLARWLLAPAAREEVVRRQAAVADLCPRVDLREDLALLAEDVRSDVRVDILTNFGNAPIVRFPRLLRPAGVVLAIAGMVALVGFFAQWLPLWPLAAVLGVDAAIIFAMRARVGEVLERTEGSGRDVRVFAALVGRLEQETFASPLLQELRACFKVQGRPASTRIAQLGRLIDWLDSSDHVLVRLFRPLVLWNEQLAISFEHWRAISGRSIGPWLSALAEFEALSCFGALAYERPHWATPVLVPNSSAHLAAGELRHPLLPESVCVPNDVSLNAARAMLVVSGSNMSGKSTLLRAIGLNTVLALAGAPVAAASLSLSTLQVGASIRINDSLQDHRSRFFAEISRLRQIVDLTKTGDPVLFLLDELLSGTNSHDRRIGAAGIVRELLEANAIGLITTHDLALANIEQDVNRGIVNVHFEDQMKDDAMTFDYKLKSGVVTRSNALALMRAVGLEV